MLINMDHLNGTSGQENNPSYHPTTTLVILLILCLNFELRSIIQELKDLNLGLECSKFCLPSDCEVKMSIVYSHSLNYSEGELRRNQEMDHHPQKHCHQHNSGLMRYCSAPSSLLSSLVDNNNNDDNNNNNHGYVNEEPFRNEDHHHQQQQHYTPSTSSEMETMFAKLIASPSNNGLHDSEPLHEFGRSKIVKEEAGDSVSQRPQHNNNNNNGGYSYGSQPQQFYQHQQIQGLSNGSVGAVNAYDNSFSAVNSTQNKTGSNNCSNLIRQKSSPAGLFNNYSVDNGIAVFREVGSFRASDVSNGQSTTSSSGLHGTLNFSSRMPQIAENGNEGLEANCVESRRPRNDNGNTKCYMPSFTNDFWDGSAFSAPKTANNSGELMFSTSNAMETQDVDFGYQKLGLTHHLSLPSSSSKLSGIEKLYQIQGSVPCKIRAKRGYATHPRSIAERERRTRISTRMKKLQDLFPKSDKQTSTADMLDVAVQYIKDMKKQVQILTDTKAKCICSSNQKQYS
ncbi:hypothetical protein RIF29_13610 [Crotalaria pallida]|uniref:BHLH domain-containing protein n=1 Tax=Crotalaria pallida TaxID=3830 RepID=A0AAN9P2B9_CROPI